ncbi:MAG: FAD-binding oxidoreductase [Planctomycetota bacterium]
MDAAAELKGLLGEANVSTDRLDLECYARDMAPMPDDLLSSYGMAPPEAAVRPGTAEEVAAVLKWARERDVPVTPRAGGSWALGGTIPIEGGVVMEISRLDKIVEINKEDRWVRVEGCMTWKRLSDILARDGLRVGTYPSSAPSAGIAGFIATCGSGGIGAPLHGPVGNQVLSMKVALTDGRVVETDPWSSWVFAGSEGTLGVICEVVLKVFPVEPRYHAMLAFDDPAKAWAAFRRIYTLDVARGGEHLRPYFMTFLDEGFANALNRAAEGSGGEHHAVPEKTVGIVASFTGPQEVLDRLKAAIEESWPDELCDAALAEHEWENRFDAVLCTKKLGPTIFSPEIQVPISELPEVFDELERVIANRDHAVEGMAVAGDVITILPVIYNDERRASDFLKVFSYTRDIVDIAYRHGGCIYGVGLHNSGHVPKIHGRGADVMRSIRAEVEPSNTLNPSKTTQVRVPYWALRMAMVFMAWTPWLLVVGLRLASFLPRPVMKFGLRMIGSQQR